MCTVNYAKLCKNIVFFTEKVKVGKRERNSTTEKNDFKFDFRSCIALTRFNVHWSLLFLSGKKEELRLHDSVNAV